MKILRSLVFSLVGVLTPVAALAFEPGARDRGLSFGAGVSTLGPSFHVGWQMSPQLGVRGLLTGFQVSDNRVVEGVDFGTTVRLGGVGPVFDFHPWQNGFRLSGGALYSLNRVSLRASGDVDIDGTPYTGVDLSGRVETAQRIMPLLAVGFDGSASRGRRGGFHIDAGALYTGGTRSAFSDANGVVSGSDLTRLARDIDDRFSRFRLAPFVNVGYRIRF